jgi:hypothetical protein
MATFEVTGPDGSTYEIEVSEGVDPQDALQRFSQQLQSSAPQQDPAKAAADEEVAKERAESPGWENYISDVARNVVRGTPVGSYIDEARGAAAWLTGGDYQKAKEYELAQQRAADKSSWKTGLHMPFGLGEVTVGGLQKLVGGMASAPFLPIAAVSRGATMAGQALNYGLTGAGYGALYGAGEGDTAGERLGNAQQGGLIGLGLGGATPFVAGGMGAAARGIGRATQRVPRQLREFDKNAVKTAAEVVGEHQGRVPYRGQLGSLADRMDVARNEVSGIASMGGAPRRLIDQRIGQRNEGAKGRVRQTLDDNLGPAQSVLGSVDNTRKAASAVAGPAFRQFHSSPPPPPQVAQQIEPLLQAARAAGAVSKAERLMKSMQRDPADPTNYWMRLDYIKRVLQDSAKTAGQQGQRTQAKVFTDLSNQIMDAADTWLGQGNKAASIWAQARNPSRQALSFEEGTKLGSKTFGRQTPEQVRAERGRLTQEGQQGFDLAAREEVRNQLGRAPSMLTGERGPQDVRRMVSSDFGRDKLAMVTDPQRAGNITRNLDNEAAYRDTYNEVMRGSQTAQRRAVQERYNSGPGVTPTISRDIPSAILNQVNRGVRAIIGANSTAARMEKARQVADMLTRQGHSADTILAALREFSRGREARGRWAEGVEALVQAFVAGSRAPAIAGANSDR